MEDSAADGVLEAGDKIVTMDKLNDLTEETIRTYLSDKKEGDIIHLKLNEMKRSLKRKLR